MTKNATKRAFMLSLLSLLMCCTMLLGTTFAWFTDTVTSTGNRIVAGTLKVDLLKYDGANYVSIANKTGEIFDGENGNGVNWEPGKTEIVYLAVANLGSLALKYDILLDVDDKGLADALEYAVLDGQQAKVTANDWATLKADAATGPVVDGYMPILPGGTLAAEKTNYFALAVHMREDAGNQFQGKEIVLDVKVVATQVEAEVDSFDNTYDNGAYFPVAPEALPAAGEDLVLNSSRESNVSVNIPATVLEGLDNGVTSLSVAASAPVVDKANKTVTFTTIELHDQNGNEVDLSNANAKVMVTLPVGDAFADGEQVEIYHDGSFVTYAIVSGGKLTYEVSHFCMVEVKAAEKVNLEVVDNVLTIKTVKEFVAFAADVNGGNSYAGKTVVLGADMDLAGVTWAPIGTSSNAFKGTFDGNGKVIKNLSVLMAGKSYVGLFGNTQDGAIKNVTVENAKVAGRLNVAVVAGQPYTSTYTNIVVKGHVEVDGMAYVGAVGGKNAYANWKDITVNVDATSYVNADSVENGTAYRTYVGGVVGFNGEGGHSFTNITTNINVIGSTCDVGGAFGIAHYGNKFENVTVTGKVTCTNATTEIGGVIGVWHNANGQTVTLTNCKYNGKSDVSVVGSAYGTDTTGKLIVDGVEVAASNATLQAQLDADKTNITLFCDISGNVIVNQKEGVNVVIDGNGHKYDGTIDIYGHARYDGAETLTIKNINFETEGAKDFISSNSTDSDKRYAHNVTVENCTFTGADGFGSVGMRYRQTFNMSIVNCTATNMHSLVQATGGNGITVTGNTVIGCKNGMSFGTTDKVTVANNNIESVGDYGYGLRLDASDAYTANITGNTISADACVLFRKATGAFTATLTKNTLNADVYTVLATAGDYEEGKALPAPTGALNVTIDGVAAAYDGASLKSILATDETVIFISDITMTAELSNGYGKTGIKVDGQTVNGNGYSLKVTNANATWDSAINVGSGKIENLKITGGFRGIFVTKTTDGAPVVLDNVVIDGPTYTISCDHASNQGLVATNSTFNGWTSFAAKIGKATFENCNFGKGAGYAFCRPYAAAEFVNCDFAAGYAMDPRTTVTLENCRLNGVLITAQNVATLATSNTANAVVK